MNSTASSIIAATQNTPLSVNAFISVPSSMTRTDYQGVSAPSRAYSDNEHTRICSS
jgi:hypothetical protein